MQMMCLSKEGLVEVDFGRFSHQFFANMSCLVSQMGRLVSRMGRLVSQMGHLVYRMSFVSLLGPL